MLTPGVDCKPWVLPGGTVAVYYWKLSRPYFDNQSCAAVLVPIYGHTSSCVNVSFGITTQRFTFHICADPRGCENYRNGTDNYYAVCARYLWEVRDSLRNVSDAGTACLLMQAKHKLMVTAPADDDNPYRWEDAYQLAIGSLRQLQEPPQKRRRVAE